MQNWRNRRSARRMRIRFGSFSLNKKSMKRILVVNPSLKSWSTCSKWEDCSRRSKRLIIRLASKNCIFRIVGKKSFSSSSTNRRWGDCKAKWRGWEGRFRIFRRLSKIWGRIWRCKKLRRKIIRKRRSMRQRRASTTSKGWQLPRDKRWRGCSKRK